MQQKAHWVQLTLFSKTYFDFVIAYGVMKLPQYTFFWVENCYGLDWNLAHIISNLNTFKKKTKNKTKTKKLFEYGLTLLLTTSYISIFCHKLNFYLLLWDCKLLFFSFFSEFSEFQCLFYKNTFFMTFIMEKVYSILAWRWLKTIELKKSFFSTHFNSLIQLCLIFTFNYVQNS